ncbi:hypothetical protein MMC16_005280 [Acarospora aff. strigata]|nr:hypothetical protein [Acarospora aff. strigata]
MANGLARTIYNTTMAGKLKGEQPKDPWAIGDWVHEMVPRVSLGQGGSAYEIDVNERKTATMSTMRATVNGYASSFDGALQKAAILCFFFTPALH